MVRIRLRNAWLSSMDATQESVIPLYSDLKMRFEMGFQRAHQRTVTVGPYVSGTSIWTGPSLPSSIRSALVR